MRSRRRRKQGGRALRRRRGAQGGEYLRELAHGAGPTSAGDRGTMTDMHDLGQGVPAAKALFWSGTEFLPGAVQLFVRQRHPLHRKERK